LTPAARFCVRHEALVAEFGEERVMAGDYPGNARKRDSVLEAPQQEEAPTLTVEANGNGAADPAAIRPALGRVGGGNSNSAVPGRGRQFVVGFDR
jgi:hypothetical protein